MKIGKKLRKLTIYGIHNITARYWIMRQAITQVVIRKYLIGAIYTIRSCDQSVKVILRITIGRRASVVTMADF